MDLDSLDPCVGLDTDGDGMSDNLGTTMLNGSACDASMYTIDDDDDNDGCDDEVDDLPYDDSDCVDTDGDGVGNDADLDDDGDNVMDVDDPFPLDGSAWADNDGDGLADVTGDPRSSATSRGHRYPPDGPLSGTQTGSFAAWGPAAPAQGTQSTDPTWLSRETSTTPRRALSKSPSIP